MLGGRVRFRKKKKGRVEKRLESEVGKEQKKKKKEKPKKTTKKKKPVSTSHDPAKKLPAFPQKKK